jgi:hypothetical protein
MAGRTRRRRAIAHANEALRGLRRDWPDPVMGGDLATVDN